MFYEHPVLFAFISAFVNPISFDSTCSIYGRSLHLTAASLSSRLPGSCQQGERRERGRTCLCSGRGRSSPSEACYSGGTVNGECWISTAPLWSLSEILSKCKLFPAIKLFASPSDFRTETSSTLNYLEAATYKHKLVFSNCA